ncbi:hypothetical protein COLO4_33992 [Corchorus olitorius]|uniref:Uncharacterized protein n=1 Tax=Corchorus olitorius TaxID=93759 RepID=A0A1R3GPF6_9ROSI|nr:hypothetical protein COLO4_33992 [Corchorus olitorius]
MKVCVCVRVWSLGRSLVKRESRDGIQELFYGRMMNSVGELCVCPVREDQSESFFSGEKIREFLREKAPSPV